MTLLRRIGIALAGVAWFALVFVVGLWITFPSTALAEYVVWRVQDGTDAWRLAASSVAPSGFGVRGDDVVLYKKTGPKVAQVVTAEHVWLSTGPWSMVNFVFGGKSTLRGSIARDGGDLSFSATVAKSEQGVKVSAASLAADDLPVSAFPPIGPAHLSGTGGVDLAVDLVSAEGLGTANGTVAITKANSLVINGITAPGTALASLDIGAIAVNELQLLFDVKKGKGKVTTGQIDTDLANIEIQGQFTLSDNLPQSRVQLKLVISLTDMFQQKFGLFKGVLSDALWGDGKYHYALAGTVSAPRFHADRERKARPQPVGSRPLPEEDAVLPPPMSQGGAVTMPGPMGAASAVSGTGDASADRAARREQAITDRRARMEERRRQLQAGGMVPEAPGMAPDAAAYGKYPDAAGAMPQGAADDMPPGLPYDGAGPPDASGPF